MWTEWRLLAQGNEWFDDAFDHDGPACYELAVGGPYGGDMRIVYTGETGNEAARMTAYGMTGSHLAEIIAWHLRQGWCLYYRAVARNTKRAAKATQDNLLRRFEYDWNLVSN